MLPLDDSWKDIHRVLNLKVSCYEFIMGKEWKISIGNIIREILMEDHKINSDKDTFLLKMKFWFEQMSHIGMRKNSPLMAHCHIESQAPQPTPNKNNHSMWFGFGKSHSVRRTEIIGQNTYTYWRIERSWL